VSSILNLASSSGVDTLDTAISYGESEARLGKAGVKNWKIVSKLPPLPANCADVKGWVAQSIDGSLERLRVEQLHGLLLHRSSDLLSSDGKLLYKCLESAKDAGKIAKIGVSIYSPDELPALLQQFNLELIQAPFNIIDRRLAETGWLARLANDGVEVHARSIFLQGLLLMASTVWPARFSPWNNLWSEWDRWLTESSLTPLQACVGFAFSQPEIARVIVGVDSCAHFSEIFNSLGKSHVSPPSVLSNSDSDLINPLSWLSP